MAPIDRMDRLADLYELWLDDLEWSNMFLPRLSKRWKMSRAGVSDWLKRNIGSYFKMSKKERGKPYKIVPGRLAHENLPKVREIFPRVDEHKVTRQNIESPPALDTFLGDDWPFQSCVVERHKSKYSIRGFPEGLSRVTRYFKPWEMKNWSGWRLKVGDTRIEISEKNLIVTHSIQQGSHPDSVNQRLGEATARIAAFVTWCGYDLGPGEVVSSHIEVPLPAIRPLLDAMAPGWLEVWTEGGLVDFNRSFFGAEIGGARDQLERIAHAPQEIDALNKRLGSIEAVLLRFVEIEEKRLALDASRLKREGWLDVKKKK